jgi:hypothetical protein
LATDYIPYHPLGIGLGGTSVGAWRFNAELDLPPIDSYFISTVITCGLPTALLFLWILARAMRLSWRGCRVAEQRSREAGSNPGQNHLRKRVAHRTVDQCEVETWEVASPDFELSDSSVSEAGWREARVWRIAATLMPVLILNSMFGNTFTLYSVAPIGWLLVGWISASALRQQDSSNAEGVR